MTCLTAWVRAFALFLSLASVVSAQDLGRKYSLENGVVGTLPKAKPAVQPNTATKEIVHDPRYAQTIAAMSAEILRQMASNDVSALSIALVESNRVVWSEGFGQTVEETGTPADGDSIFLVGSVSKTFTAVALMQLVEQGKVGLDTPVTNYLPELTLLPRYTNQMQFTPRQLLSQMSGLPTDYLTDAWSTWPLASDADRVLGALSNDYPLMPPGFVPVYCNNGWEVAEKLIERVTGAVFQEYMRTNIFATLDMTNSAYSHDPLELGSQMASSYYQGRRLPHEHILIQGAGGMSSSVNDLSKYLATVLGHGVAPNGKRLLQEATLEQMFERQSSRGLIQLEYPGPLDEDGLGFDPGLGWDCVVSEPFAYAGRYACKGGNTVTQHSTITLLPDAQLAVAITVAGSLTPEALGDLCLHYATLDKLGVFGPTNTLVPEYSPIVPWTPDAQKSVAGAYATESGWDLIQTNPADNTLTWTIGAQSDAPQVVTGLVARASGWFSSPTSQSVELCVTNVLDQSCLLKRKVFDHFHREWLYGQRFTPPTVSAIWSNRTGIYVPHHLFPYSYEMQIGVLSSHKLAVQHGVLCMDDIPFVPINDTLALRPFFNLRGGAALQFDSATGWIKYGDELLEPLAAAPLLNAGTFTNGMVSVGEVHWFRVPVTAGSTYTIDLQTEAPLRAWINNGMNIGWASGAHAFQFSSKTNAEYLVGVMKSGDTGGSFRLAVHTNALPFWRPLESTNWPADMITYSNRFGNLSFGHVFVPENRNNLNGNVLKLGVALMKSATPSAQPLFFCNGGPGVSSIRDTAQYYLKQFTDNYDVYLIDQRGLGYSQPDLNFQPGEDITELQYRLKTLERADLSSVNTVESSYDLDDIHTAFQLTHVNLMGLSYGTLLSQTLMRRSPAWLRSVILDGVVAPNIPAVAQTGPIRYEAIMALSGDVAANSKAAAWYPDFAQQFFTLTTNLQQNPVTLNVRGEPVEMDGVAFLQAVFMQLSASDLGSRERIPNIVFRALAGETAALAELETAYHLDPAKLLPSSDGEIMNRLILRHDMLPFESMDAVTNACAQLPGVFALDNILYAKYVYFDYANEMDWVGQADPWFATPVYSAIPTLVINGTYDCNTGVGWAAEVASHLANSYLVVVPTVGHGVLLGGDIPLQTMRNFLADPWHDPTPASLADMHLDFPPPWPTNTSLLVSGQPVTLQFEQATQGAWYRLSAVQGVTYDLEGTLPSGTLRVLDASGRILVTAPEGLTHWQAPADGDYYIWIVASAPGTAQLALSNPLLIRNLQVGDQHVLTWQGKPNQDFEIWATPRLDDQHPFVRIGHEPASAGWIHSFTNSQSGESMFYRVREASPQ